MDARQMKKVIQLDALEKYRYYLAGGYPRQLQTGMPPLRKHEIMQILDITQTQSLTGAQWDRFIRVLNEMIENAESKI